MPYTPILATLAYILSPDGTQTLLIHRNARGDDQHYGKYNGLGGKLFSEQHAINSAKILNEIQPYYASTLVLSFPFAVEQYRTKFKAEYQEMTTQELLLELKLFIENLDLKQTIFRSDHASNYLVLKGNLSRDKNRFLSELDNAINNPSRAGLRPEWSRGL